MNREIIYPKTSISDVITLFKKELGLIIRLDNKIDPEQIDIYRFLISCKDYLKYTNENGDTILHVACKKGKDTLVKNLLKTKCISDCENKEGETPVIIAARRGDEKIIGMFIKEKLFGTDQYREGNSLLHLLALHGHTKFLIKVINTIKEGLQQFTLSITNIYGETPLHLACKGRTSDCIKILTDYGVDLNIKDKNGMTPLHNLCININSHSTYCKYLIKKGANINHKNNKGRTPIHLACFVKRQSICEMLIKEKADINAVDTKLNTPLHLLVKNLNTINMNFVKYLIEHGANVQQENLRGESIQNYISGLKSD